MYVPANTRTTAMDLAIAAFFDSSSETNAGQAPTVNTNKNRVEDPSS